MFKHKPNKSCVYLLCAAFHKINTPGGQTHSHKNRTHAQSQGCMRMAPSSLMTSPLIMGFSASDVTRWANSAGSPRREGKGTWRARKERTFSGRLARRGVENRPGGTTFRSGFKNRNLNLIQKMNILHLLSINSLTLKSKGELHRASLFPRAQRLYCTSS